MNRGDPRDWMWSEALQMLAQAERLHRQVFQPRRLGASSGRPGSRRSTCSRPRTRC